MMQRGKFITSVLTLAGLTVAPMSLLARKVNRQSNEKGFKVGAGQDRFNKSISLFEGDTFSTKISTMDTHGDLYVFESTRINNGGPAQHFHYEQDEWWYVLQGEFAIKIGDQLFEAKAGDSVFGPRGVPHVWAKVGEGEGKLLMIFQPAGKMEEFFKAVSEGKLSGLNADEQQEFRKAHGFEVMGPALNHHKQ